MPLTYPAATDGRVALERTGTPSGTAALSHPADIYANSGTTGEIKLTNDGGLQGLITMQGVKVLALSGSNQGLFVMKDAAGKLSFFDSTPVVKPTGVAVTAAGIHAALVSLGLIAA